MAEDKGDLVLGAEVSEPVPIEDALRRYDQVLAIGLDGFEKASAVAGKVLVKQDVALGVQNAQIKGAGMKVDAAVVLMLAGIESHGSPPGLDEWSHSHPAYRLRGRSRRGPVSVSAGLTHARSRSRPLALHGPWVCGVL